MQKQLWLGALLLGVCVALATGVCPQTAQTTQRDTTSPTEAPGPTFTSRTEVVLVPVAVREKSGQVASGLKKDDFRLLVDGQQVPIASFEEVKSGAAPALLPVTPGVYTNRIANEDKPQRLTVILLDYLNTPFLNQEEERQEIAKFVAHELKPDEPVALLALTRQGLRMLQSFTTNSGDLSLAIRRARDMSRSEMNGLHWVGSLPQDDPSAPFILRDRIRTTLDELEQLGNALAGVPGRKVVVWTTGGFPFLLRERHSPTPSTEFVVDYERVWHTLNQANVSLYPIDAKGLVNTLFEGRFSAANARAPIRPGIGLRPRYDLFAEEQNTLKQFASETGGVACMNRNQYASCIDAAQREAVDYYLLSFAVTPEMRNKAWNKIHVKTDGRYEVRARQGFTVEKPDPKDAKDEIRLMGKALRSPLEYTGLKMSFRWLDVQPIPGGTTAPAPEKSPAAKHPPVATAKFRLELAPRSVELDTAGHNRLQLTLMAVALDENGEYVTELAKSIDAHLNDANLSAFDTGGTNVENEVALPAGRLRVRFAVRDRLTGRIGTVEAPIEVPGKAGGTAAGKQ